MLRDKQSGRECLDARGAVLPEVYADPLALNVPELFNGAAVHHISNQAADKELAGEPMYREEARCS